MTHTEEETGVYEPIEVYANISNGDIYKEIQRTNDLLIQIILVLREIKRGTVRL